MRSKDELKELEGYFKKVNLNFSIWVLIKILDRFESEVEIFLKENIDSNKSGGVLKSMLTLNEAIIDVKEG